MKISRQKATYLRLEEEKRTSVGSGRHKSEGRLAIEKADLMSLLKDNSLKQIADMFEVSTYMVTNELSKRFKSKEVGFSAFKNLGVQDEDNLNVEGAWMLSEERNSYLGIK